MFIRESGEPFTMISDTGNNSANAQEMKIKERTNSTDLFIGNIRPFNAAEFEWFSG